jgi:hypothetical protein
VTLPDKKRPLLSGSSTVTLRPALVPSKGAMYRAFTEHNPVVTLADFAEQRTPEPVPGRLYTIRPGNRLFGLATRACGSLPAGDRLKAAHIAYGAARSLTVRFLVRGSAKSRLDWCG